MEKDTISKIICRKLNIRAYSVTSLNTIKEITKIHDTTPNVTLALGRTLTATALMSATLKPESNQSVAIKFNGSGPVGEVHAQADSKGNIRGYAANPKADLSGELDSLSFSKTIGAGFLTVVKNLQMKSPYSSVTPLVYGEVADDIAYYLTVSEQIPSALILGMNIDKNGETSSAGGILIQTFPDTEDHVIENVEKNITSMTENLGDQLKNGNDIYSIVSEIFDNNPLDILSAYPLKASCSCNREIISSVFNGIDRKELEDMIIKDNGAEAVCTFCKKVYTLSEQDLKNIIKNKQEKLQS